MKKVIEIINLSVLNTESSVTKKVSLEAGFILGMSIYSKDVDSDGTVNAGLKINGNEIIPLHTIENFRNRETEFGKGYIPLNIDGGKEFQVTIQADEPFKADATFQAVFFYDTSENC